MKPFRPSTIATYLSAVFVAGTIAGLAAGYQWGLRKKPEVERPRDMTSFLIHRMSKDLELRPDQLEQIGPILSNATARIRTLHRETSKQVEGTMQTAHDEIRPLLDANQLERLADMEARRANWIKERGMGPRTNGGKPGPDPSKSVGRTPTAENDRLPQTPSLSPFSKEQRSDSPGECL